MKTGIYPGSFDPLTNGHVDVIEQALQLVDHLVIAIGVHHGKTPLFDADEREVLILKSLSPFPDLVDRVSVTTFASLVVDAARTAGATVIVRGLRDATDFDYEMQMTGMNRGLAPDIITVFVGATPETRHISATLVRQIAGMKGDIRPFVPTAVADAFAARHPNA
ncbi:MAG: pantetheine-phosphate adenylyltransferase [Pseudomonadota bacterium]